MRQTQYPSAVLAMMLSACATEPVLLNSERIEKRFRNYGIEVLASEAGLRRSSLYSLHDRTAICRTYALVRFADQLDEQYREEHAQVLSGNSIGATFRSQGWDVHKQTTYIGRLALPGESTAIGDLMRISGKQELALHVYQLLLVSNDNVYEYATIMETHHPEYLSEKDLHELYEFDTATAMPSQAVADIETLILGRENSTGKFVASP
ncbi:MAG: hypothetical protein KJO95_00780 [Gammaproteobacteria bacterium]|nr:hypothetical protein [Gammaproteobacteria bacterium]MBU2678584.1 hypothetical protein [Gammaproteobacteria bacterium]NNC57550.1 hypothetical protein [Woeseiaceae bacterium]NNL52318.1 hypothetical protein [Woeseiaceae bacterium]